MAEKLEQARAAPRIVAREMHAYALGLADETGALPGEGEAEGTGGQGAGTGASRPCGQGSRPLYYRLVIRGKVPGAGKSAGRKSSENGSNKTSQFTGNRSFPVSCWGLGFALSHGRWPDLVETPERGHANGRLGRCDMTQTTTIDWLRFRTQGEPGDVLGAVRPMFGEMGRHLKLGDHQRGLFGFHHSRPILLGDAPVARLDFGGESQRGWTRVDMPGKGCEFVSDWEAVDSLEDLPSAQIRRLDIALTTWDGGHP